jgi:hypothetical protein
MNVVRVKDGVMFSVIAPGGFHILSAIDQTAAKLGIDLTITSACDGVHSGELDPHHFGNAYDVRTHDLTDSQKGSVLAVVMDFLGWESFYGFLESPGTDNEHIHVQVKKGTTYPPDPTS